MSGEELINKILGGERDFSGINLEVGFKFSRHDGYNNLKDYLRNNATEEKPPYNFASSKLVMMTAKELYLPFASFENADFKAAEIYDSDFTKANFNNAYFWAATIQDSNFSEANLEGAYLKQTTLSGINFTGANMKGVDLIEADLQFVQFNSANLQNAKMNGVGDGAIISNNFEGANLEGATYTKEELESFDKTNDMNNSSIKYLRWSNYSS